MKRLLEVCVDSIDSVKAAIAGGAQRLELCSALDAGGLTPSYGLLLCTKELVSNVPVMVMIRPRSGDFNYNESEISLMLKEIEVLKPRSDGFVFGLLNVDGTVDVENCRRLIAAASPLPCTFHRAFDVTPDPEAAMQQIIDLGFVCILTSGQAPTALEGVDLIERLHKKSANRIIIMPGAGVNKLNLEKILKQTQVNEFHASASSTVTSRMSYKNRDVKMGTAQDELSWKVCDEEKVRELVALSNRI